MKALKEKTHTGSTVQVDLPNTASFFIEACVGRGRGCFFDAMVYDDTAVVMEIQGRGRGGGCGGNVK